MGDCTDVTLRVLTEQAKAVRKLGARLFTYGVSEDGPHSVFEFDDIRFATLGFEDRLVEAGIAYDKTWGAGYDYSAGVEYVRFTPDGDLQQIELDEGEDRPPLDELLALCDTPELLADFVRAFALTVTPLPWDNQAEYGRIYTTKEAQ
jgi:hypothetical protein